MLWSFTAVYLDLDLFSFTLLCQFENFFNSGKFQRILLIFFIISTSPHPGLSPIQSTCFLPRHRTEMISLRSLLTSISWTVFHLIGLNLLLASESTLSPWRLQCCTPGFPPCLGSGIIQTYGLLASFKHIPILCSFPSLWAPTPTATCELVTQSHYLLRPQETWDEKKKPGGKETNQTHFVYVHFCED